MNPRQEPVLWLQLVGLGVIPVELLLVLLLLAGSDPGPFPGLERTLSWSLGALAPAVVLWRLIPDPFSLLLLCSPPQQRLPEQLELTREPVGLGMKLLLASGAAVLLPTLWWLDTNSVLATSYALLPTSSRLISLLAITPVLALMLWQWQQLVQAIAFLGGWIVSKESSGASERQIAENTAANQRLCLGLPWLKLPRLKAVESPARPSSKVPTASETISVTIEQKQIQSAQQEQVAADSALVTAPEPNTDEPETTESETTESETSEPGVISSVPDQLFPGGEQITDVEFIPIDSEPVAIEPEQAAEQEQSSNLDQQIG